MLTPFLAKLQFLTFMPPAVAHNKYSTDSGKKINKNGYFLSTSCTSLGYANSQQIIKEIPQVACEPAEYGRLSRYFMIF